MRCYELWDIPSSSLVMETTDRHAVAETVKEYAAKFGPDALNEWSLVVSEGQSWGESISGGDLLDALDLRGVATR